MPKFTCTVCLLLLIMSARAQRFSADTINKTIYEWVRELGAKHPGMYRYHTKADFKSYVDSVTSTITDSLTELQVYRKFKPIVSRIGCLHTGLKHIHQFDSAANLFPFQLYFVEQRAYLIDKYPGAEVVSINGRSIPELLNILLPAIPSDGYNMTMKYRSLYHSFPTWYRSMVEVADSFVVTCKQPALQTFTVPAVTYNTIARSGFLNEEFSFPKQLEFSITDSIGRLTIHSFARSDIKKSKQQFQPFIKDAFKQLRSVNNLIIDLRYNTGGSDANAAYFTSYFFDKPYRYWDRIEVTPAIAKSIKGIFTLFYRKPVQKDSLWLWRKARTAKDFNFYTLQRPAKNNYKGNVYVLINGFCMSSCADASAVLAHNKKAIFIGEETGGGYQGNTSGMMPVATVTPTNLQLTVPLQKYVNAVDPSVWVGRGTLPHYPINPTVKDIIEQKDLAMEKAVGLIRNKRP
jgi:hypothetical protein